jgi:predicted ester cyclase
MIGPVKPSPASRIQAANAALVEQEDLAAIGDYFARDYVAHGTGKDFKGHRFIRQHLGELRRAFPKLRIDVEVLLEGGDRVAWQRTWRGKQVGAYQGFPATGKTIVWRDLVVTRFQGGLIAEDWVITDLAEQLLRARKR